MKLVGLMLPSMLQLRPSTPRVRHHTASSNMGQVGKFSPSLAANSHQAPRAVDRPAKNGGCMLRISASQSHPMAFGVMSWI